MTKRKEPEVKEESISGEESSSEDDTDMLNVDFEWFDPQPGVDFHGIKTLLRQLFDVDAQLFDLSALTDLLLAQPKLGSTVKVDGNETDPYAFLTVLNLHEHKSVPVIGSILDYLVAQTKKNIELSKMQVLLQKSNQAQIGLILTERLINIPSEVVPPMYKMLLEEISWAIEDKEPYNFTHYLIMSKTYREIASVLDQEDDNTRKIKRAKKSSGKNGNFESFYFHPEDEALQRYAEVYGSYNYELEAGEGQSDAKRAFQELGIKPEGHMILIEAGKFAEAIEDLQQYFGQS